MTRSDYELIADAIKASIDADDLHDEPAEVEEREELLEALCTAFKRDNPRFVRGVFMHRALGYIPERPLEEL